MKATDKKVITYLRDDSRMNLTSISRKTGIPVSTIFDKLKQHRGNMIQRFTVLLDFSKLGYPIRAKIFLKVNPAHKEELRNYLYAHRSVNNLWRINNGYDYAAECLFTSIRENEEFLDEIEMRFKIEDKHVFHIIEDVAREKMLSRELETDIQ